MAIKKRTKGQKKANRRVLERCGATERDLVAFGQLSLDTQDAVVSMLLLSRNDHGIVSRLPQHILFGLSRFTDWESFVARVWMMENVWRQSFVDWLKSDDRPDALGREVFINLTASQKPNLMNWPK